MATFENTTNLVCKRHRKILPGFYQALARSLGPRVQFRAVDTGQPCAANLAGCHQLASYQFEIVHNLGGGTQ